MKWTRKWDHTGRMIVQTRKRDRRVSFTTLEFVSTDDAKKFMKGLK